MSNVRPDPFFCYDRQTEKTFRNGGIFGTIENNPNPYDFAKDLARYIPNGHLFTSTLKMGGDLWALLSKPFNRYHEAYNPITREMLGANEQLDVSMGIISLAAGPILEAGPVLAEARLASAPIVAEEAGVTKGAVPLEKQAADLIPLNAGKNRVTLRSEGQQLDVDLAGKAHNGIPTPHTKVSLRNTHAPEHLQPVYNTTEKQSTLRPATQEDIRTVRRYLERK